MKLDFGIFDHLDRNDLALHDLYEQRLKVIELFDRFGFYAYHVAEHHFTPLGMAPSPSVFLSAVSQRTKRLRFGTFVYALPVHHPLRVLEEICMLDHMSGGRLEIGFGRGSVPFEIAYYGQNAQERQQIYAERLELILKAFAVGTLTWQGRYRLFALAFEFCLSVGNAWCTAGFAAECGKLRPADWARTGHCWLGRHGSRLPSQANGD